MYGRKSQEKGPEHVSSNENVKKRHLGRKLGAFFFSVVLGMSPLVYEHLNSEHTKNEQEIANLKETVAVEESLNRQGITYDKVDVNGNNIAVGINVTSNKTIYFFDKQTDANDKNPNGLVENTLYLEVGQAVVPGSGVSNREIGTTAVITNAVTENQVIKTFQN
jgi:hypothetical protein